MERLKYLFPSESWRHFIALAEVVTVVSLSIVIPLFLAVTAPLWILPVLLCWRKFRKQRKHYEGIVSLAEAKNIRLEADDKVVVFTNGHFDLLHEGHLSYLEKTRELGDMLIVGLNDDASTRTLKGDGRPIIPQKGRALMLAALSCVDYVIIFEGLTANVLVKALKPDIYVKGGDWGEGRMPPEAEIVTDYGGQVCILPYLPEHSTTKLIETIVKKIA